MMFAETDGNDDMDPLLTNIGQNDNHSCSTIEQHRQVNYSAYANKNDLDESTAEKCYKDMEVFERPSKADKYGADIESINEDGQRYLAT